MLSAHTTDKSVNTATRKLFPVANTPQKILALGVEGVMPYLKTVGLYRGKAKNLMALSQHAHREARREDPARPRGARGAARRGPQDREHHPQHGVRREDDRGRHAHLPRVEPHRARAGQQSARGRGCAGRATCRPPTRRMRITGCCCTAATSARRACRRARNASSGICASTATRRRKKLPNPMPDGTGFGRTARQIR